MKWILRFFGLILVIIIVAGLSIFLLPAEQVARIAADQLRNVTGRDVTISGDVSMSVWPVLGVTAGGIEVGNADWAEGGPMLTAENAAIGVDAASLLRGEIRITNIEATAPTIRLEQRLDGRASWEFTDASGEAQIETEVSPDEPPQAFSIQRLNVTDATLIYDAEGSDRVSYSGVDLSLDWPEQDGAADIVAQLRPTATPVDVTARIDRFSGFLAGEVQPVSFDLAAGGNTAKFEGRAATSGEVAGRLDMNMASTDTFLAALALPPPGLPRGLGQSVSGGADLTLTTDRQLALRNLGVDLGGNRLNGAADISLNGKPQITAQLDAGPLDLTSATGGSSGGSGSSGSSAASSSSGWPKDPIDASGLAAFDAQIALAAQSIDLGQFKLGPTRAMLTNDNSRMVFEMREVSAYGGSVTGQVVVNNRSGLSVGGDINAAGIQMESLLSDAVGLDRLTGAGDARIKFLGSGGNMDAIMRSLSGDGSLSIGSGRILGIDLDRLMRSGDITGGTTIFDSLNATYTMSGGNLVNEDLLLSLSSFEARGAGRVGLGSQDIDYLFTPVALKVNEGSGLAIPIRIRGPWSGPSILPDLEQALDLNLSVEKEKLEQQAREAVSKKIEEELGVKTEDGKSLEDAAKDKIENELKKGLRGIFD